MSSLKSHPATLAVVLAAILGACLTACSGGGQETIRRGPWSVVLLTLDTTRPDHLAPYGARDAETPHLDTLAREGVLFERAHAVTPVTLPSHATLLTGLDPPHHGVRNNGIHHLDQTVTTLPEELRDAGWRTAAFVSAAVLERRYGLDQGFEVYDDDLSGGGPREARTMTERPAAVTVQAALDWLDGLADGERFFLWVHLFDPHAPYAPPPPFGKRFAESPYDGEIAAMDAAIGRLLAHPRLASRNGVVTVAVGDHGESLGEHGEQTHGMLVYDATMRVPFLLRLPHGPHGLRVATPVSQVDLVPTLADLLGLPEPTGPGRSLLPVLAGETPPESGRDARVLYGESDVAFYAYGWARLRTVWRGWEKYIEAPAVELYDLERDPGELENLVQGRSGRAADLALQLEILSNEVPDAGPDESRSTLDTETEARLRSLGYLPTGGRRPEGAPRPDPKAMIGVHEDLQRVGTMLQNRRFAEAARALRGVLAKDPDNPSALRDLARALAETERWEAAAAALERALVLDPSDAALHLALADLEARRDASPRGLERALELSETALALDPRSREARLDQARYLARLGRTDEARERMAAALEGGAGDPWVETRYAELVDLPAGDLARAEARLRGAVERDPNLADAWLLLGDVLERDGRTEEAAEVYRGALRHLPQVMDLHARLGRRLAQAGDPQAEPVLRRALEQAREQSQPPPVEVLQNLAALALSGRRWSEAEAWAQQAVEADPSLAAAWNGLGIAREEQGRRQEAEEAYRHAEEADPDYWQASFNRGLLLVEEREFPGAAAAFERVLAHAPDHAGAHFQLGLLQAGPLGEPAQARHHLEAALAAEPEHPRARQIREILTRL